MQNFFTCSALFLKSFTKMSVPVPVLYSGCSGGENWLSRWGQKAKCEGDWVEEQRTWVGKA